MKLEDLSKDELLYLIRKRNLLYQYDFKNDVWYYRIDKCIKELLEYDKKLEALLTESKKIMEPYQGQPLKNVPMDVMKKEIAIMKQRDVYYKKIQQKENEYKKLSMCMGKAT